MVWFLSDWRCGVLRAETVASDSAIHNKSYLCWTCHFLSFNSTFLAHRDVFCQVMCECVLGPKFTDCVLLPLKFPMHNIALTLII